MSQRDGPVDRAGGAMITRSDARYTIYRDDWGMWTLTRPERGGSIGCGTFERVRRCTS